MTPATPLRAADKSDPQGKPATDEKAGKAAEEPEVVAAANPFPRRFKAQELDGGTGWLNTTGEITLKDLRGKVVLLDFWTYCCINCMHILPDLKHLERKYDKQLVVIGVHSAKFENERESDNIRRAIMRYEIEHPVVNDSEMTIWRKFNVNSWPTLVLIDPEGFYCGFVSGEGNREALEEAIDKVIAYHKRKGTLDESPVRFDLERDRAEATPLRFPGKLLADEAGNRLFISDSNHNRIVITSLDGRLLDVVGTGAIGKENGAYDRASFDHPQGLALVRDTLYVADTENHLIRAIDLSARQVRNVA
ncbi:MAG TPA: thioredoxin-like domain-containing protein, partial [Planctomycetaceae bacterium]|nr:thioredoxin-like domain-containing protein [Planctomycetaceae bacterium]